MTPGAIRVARGNDAWDDRDIYVQPGRTGWAGLAGLAIPGASVIFLDTSGGPYSALGTLAHELGHLVTPGELNHFSGTPDKARGFDDPDLACGGFPPSAECKCD